MQGYPLNDTYRILLDISKRIGQPMKKILDLVFLLREGGRIENAHLIQKVGVGKHLLNEVKSALATWLTPVSPSTSLSETGKKKTEGLFSPSYTSSEELYLMFDKSAVAARVRETLAQCERFRPSPERDYDQFTATVETTARRVALLDFFCDVAGKRLLFLGDDDFTSFGVSLLGTAEKITALDIDSRIIAGLSGAASSFQTRIDLSTYDARLELPPAFRASYDVVFTDPPYTPRGIALFVSRAIQSLDRRGNAAARVYLCYGNSDKARERFLPIYEILTRSGLMMRYVFDGFNRYIGAQSIGSASSLFVCDTTPKTKPLVGGRFSKDIYTNEL